MNSSFIIILFSFLYFALFIKIFLIFREFPPFMMPNRWLGYIGLGSLMVALLWEMAAWEIFIFLFYYPPLIFILWGLSAGSVFAINEWLLLEHPTQLQQRVLLRLPILLGLFGWHFKFQSLYLYPMVIMVYLVRSFLKGKWELVRWELLILLSLLGCAWSYDLRHEIGFLFYWLLIHTVIKLVKKMFLRELIHHA